MGMSSPTITCIGDDVAEVTVTVGDHRDVKAKIIGVDSWTDLALLKIDRQACR